MGQMAVRGLAPQILCGHKHYMVFFYKTEVNDEDCMSVMELKAHCYTHER